MVIGLNKEPRLHFSEEERADRILQKPIRKAEHAVEKADRAWEKVPKKTVRVKKRTTDPVMGKTVVRLHFEEAEKAKTPSKLEYTLRGLPSDLVGGRIHKQIRNSEEDNVGVESTHKLEETTESGVRLAQKGHYHHKLKLHRKAQSAERQLEKANVNVLYQKSIRSDPKLSSKPVSRWQQKQAIKKQYAAAKHSGYSARAAMDEAGKISKATQGAVKKAGWVKSFISVHRRGFFIAIIAVLLLCFLLDFLSACSVMTQTVGTAIAGSTYPSKDEDMLGAEAIYTAKEEELQAYLDCYERTHDYDEYHFVLDEIEHDPYVLISILTAFQGGEWRLLEVQDTLQMLFDRQYILTEEVERETRSRTETRIGTQPVTDPVTGMIVLEEYEYEAEIEYDYYICTVTLDNFDLSHLPVYIMNEQQVAVYAIYMATHGNRPDLFPQSLYPHASQQKDYITYDVPPELMEDEQFAAMLKEAEKYLGFPYVWGGSNPSTSFDCSGFVSWVVNHSGWNVGRQSAQGLCNICTPVSDINVKPGDLVFFRGTYDTPGVSHVGIYVGNSMMIHCGDPISYASLDNPYWQRHFYTYGRLP